MKFSGKPYIGIQVPAPSELKPTMLYFFLRWQNRKKLSLGKYVQLWHKEYLQSSAVQGHFPPHSPDKSVQCSLAFRSRNLSASPSVQQ